MTGSISEYERERDLDTLPSPASDEEPTGPHHDIPSFVGQPPKQIPQAPEPMNEILTKLDQLLGIANRLDTNQEAATREFRIQNEARKGEIRELDFTVTRQGNELEEVRSRLGRAESDLKDARRRIEELEREALNRIDDFR